MAAHARVSHGYRPTESREAIASLVFAARPTRLDGSQEASPAPQVLDKVLTRRFSCAASRSHLLSNYPWM
jgi:hypothetical protein